MKYKELVREIRNLQASATYHSSAKLSERFGLPRQWVGREMWRSLRYEQRTKFLLREAAQFHEDGRSHRLIAYYLGVPREAVREHMELAGFSVKTSNITFPWCGHALTLKQWAAFTGLRDGNHGDMSIRGNLTASRSWP
jgi:hypothetical protein